MNTNCEGSVIAHSAEANRSAAFVRSGGEVRGEGELADEARAELGVREEGDDLAHEIAASAPLAVQSTRATLRKGLVEQIRLAVAHESTEQNLPSMTLVWSLWKIDECGSWLKSIETFG